MEYREVADSGLTVSAIGLGTVDFGARLDAAASQKLVSAAIEAGIALFDTGDNYNDGRSEEILGLAIRGHRNEAVVSTKFTGRDRFRSDGSRRFALELAMSWLSGQAGVSSVLVGASSAAQLEKNAAAIGWALSAEERVEIGRLLESLRDPGEVPFNK